MLYLNSITDVGPDARGQIAVSGSHGGIYPASIASAAGLRAVAFNDAGVGYEQAGTAGVLRLADVGVAAIGVDCQSCRIGDAADMIERGRVSFVNSAAVALDVDIGQPVKDAMARMAGAPLPTGQLPKIAEARHTREIPGVGRVELLDSASLVGPEDAGRIVITGSHGALIGGDPSRALKARARIAAFNDAGVGIEGVGVTRLPALDKLGIAAVTVDAQTARIGDAASTLETGVISRMNETAAERGAVLGQRLADWLAKQD